jgi:hypothetical protein
MDSIVQITVIGRSISSRPKGKTPTLQVVEPIRQVIHQRMNNNKSLSVTLREYLLMGWGCSGGRVTVYV